MPIVRLARIGFGGESSIRPTDVALAVGGPGAASTQLSWRVDCRALPFGMVRRRQTSRMTQNCNKSPVCSRSVCHGGSTGSLLWEPVPSSISSYSPHGKGPRPASYSGARRDLFPLRGAGRNSPEPHEVTYRSPPRSKRSSRAQRPCTDPGRSPADFGGFPTYGKSFGQTSFNCAAPR